MSDNLQRILTAAIGAPVALIAAYTGGATFAVAVAAVGLVGQMELYRMGQQAGADPSVGSGLVMGILVIVALANLALWPAPALGLLFYIVAAPFWVEQEQFLPSFSITLAGVLYPTGLLGSLLLLRAGYVPDAGPRPAFWLVVMVFGLVWATDVTAYYVGTWLGERPLAPDISPNKTWEGTLAGFGAAIAVAVATKLTVLPVLMWGDVAMVAVLAGAVGQVGDLVESQLKRSTGADDASGLLPGHGGVLDRFDAMAVAAPLIYIYLLVVGLI